jgi:hypothetical protein
MTAIIDASSCTGNRRAAIHRLQSVHDSRQIFDDAYPHGGVDPNGITQSLIAVLAGLQVAFLCTETDELGEEVVASHRYHVHLYHWLETNDHGCFLSDNDL